MYNEIHEVLKFGLNFSLKTLKNLKYQSYCKKVYSDPNKTVPPSIKYTGEVHKRIRERCSFTCLAFLFDTFNLFQTFKPNIHWRSLLSVAVESKIKVICVG